MTRRTQTLSKTEILYTEKLGDYGCNAYIFVIHYSFLESIQGITVEVYSQEMDEMHIRLSKMKPALVNRRGPILVGPCCHDNISEAHQLEIQDFTIFIIFT